MARGILFEVAPLKNGTPVTINMSRWGSDSNATQVDGKQWLPIITQRHQRSMGIASSGQLTVPTTSWGGLTVALGPDFGNEEISSYVWNGQPGRLWVGDEDEPFENWTLQFTGTVGSIERQNNKAVIQLLGPEADLTGNLLSLTYAGIGGAEGPGSMMGTLKPRAFGTCLTVEPIQIDPVNLVYQVHGYGPVLNIPHVYEFAQALDPAKNKGNFASYDALCAVPLVAGEWAICTAQGLFRLGAQPSNKISADVIASGGTIAAVGRQLLNAGGVADARIGDLSAFDGKAFCLYQTDQVSVIDAARNAFLQGGGYLFADGAGVWQCGDYFAPKTPIAVSDDGTTTPFVRSIKELASTAPVWKVSVGFDKCWSVHSESDVSPALSAISDAQLALEAALQQAQEDAAVALADVATAAARIATMDSDGFIDRSEKLEVIRRLQDAQSEFTGLSAQGSQYNVTAEQTAYVTAYQNLIGYENALVPSIYDSTQDTPINPATDAAIWNAFYVARADLKVANVGHAGTTSTWTGVSGDGKPADNATVGAPAGTPVAGVDAGELVDAIKDNNGNLIKAVDILGTVDALEQVFGTTVAAAASAAAAANAQSASAVAQQAATAAMTDAQAARDTALQAQALSNTSAGLADTAKTDAQTARDAANQARDLANTSAGQADAAKVDAQAARDAASSASAIAAGQATIADSAKADAQAARDAAQTAQTVAQNAAATSGTSATSAQGFATTASGQATIATQQADASSQSASIASGQATVASTKAGEASISASQAATSENNAQGSANSAATSAGVSATARDSSKLSAATTVPSNFTDPSQWLTERGSPSFAGGVVSNGTPDAAGVYSLGHVPVVAGHTYQITAVHRVVTEGTAGSLAYFGFVPYNASGASLGIIPGNGVQLSDMWVVQSLPVSASQGWVTTVATFTGDAVLSVLASAVGMSVVGLTGWNSGGAATQLASLALIDNTATANAGKSASAAATSASSAAASSDLAGQRASASDSSRVDAQTAAGAAGSYRDQAAASASSASGSQQTASQQAGVSTSAALQATQTSAALLPSDFTQGSTYWTSYYGTSPIDAGNHPLDPSWTFNSEAAHGTFVQHTGPGDLASRGSIELVADRVYKITAEWLVQYSVTTPNAITLFAIGNNAGYTANTQNFANAFSITPGGTGWGTSQPYLTSAILFDSNLFLANGATSVRPMLRLEGSGTGSTYWIRSLRIEDVTGVQAATGAANASAGSASTAASSASAAVQSASAAQADRVAADTASGNAAAYRDQAAASKNDAAGSASSAATSAGVSATARDAAHTIVANLLPETFNDQSFFSAADYHNANTYWETHNGFTDWTGTTTGSGGYAVLNTIGSIKAVPGRKYQVSALVSSWGGVSSPSIGFSIGLSNNTATATDRNYHQSFDPLVFVNLVSDIVTPDTNWVSIAPRIVMREGTWFVRSLTLEDVTEREAALVSANAASTSASNAAASNSAAGQNASAAQTSATNAQTYEGQALTYRDQASVSASNAAGSQQTATQQAGVATQAYYDANQAYINAIGQKDLAVQYANASAGSANTAGSQATAAGQSASAAQADRVAADTSAGTAGASRDQAATSASNAAGSANSAATSAIVSATARDAAQVALQRTFPPTLDPSGRLAYYLHGSSNIDGSIPEWPQPFAEHLAPGALMAEWTHRFLQPMNRVEGQTYRFTCYIYAGGNTRFFMCAYDGPNDATINRFLGVVGTDITPISGGWVKMVGEFTMGPEHQAFLWPSLNLNLTDGQPNAANLYMTGIVLENVTQSNLAAGSATAASNSASTAAAQNTAAGQNASAAQTSATNASTSAGNALTYSNNASSSASTAQDSANTATAQAGVSSSAALQAVQTGAALMPYDFSEGGKFWSRIFDKAPATQIQYPLDSSAWMFQNQPGFGAVVVHAQGGDISTVGSVPVVADRKYQITAKWLVQYSNGGPNEIELYAIGNNAGFVNNVYNPSFGFDSITPGGPGWGTSNGWHTTTLLIDANDLISHGVAELRPLLRLEPRTQTTSTYWVGSIRIEDVTGVLAAQNAATAASGSASTASTKADQAGQQASAALASQQAAGTSAGNALASQQSAANSASNALGSQQSAASSASLSATAQDATQLIFNKTFPSTLDPIGRKAYYLPTPITYIAGPSTGWPQAYISATDTGAAGYETYVRFQKLLPFVSGRHYRVTTWIFSYATNMQFFLGLYGSPNEDAAYTNAYHGTLTAIAHPTSPGFVKLVGDFTVDGLSSAYFDPRLVISPADGQLNNGLYHTTGLVLEDITSQIASEGSAAASANNASAASASQTAAGQQASAAQQSAIDASTARGQAQGYASQAAQSVSDAQGSASTASQQAGLSAQARADTQSLHDDTASLHTDTGALREHVIGLASASQGSASTASAQADAAGQSASSASQSANNALTYQGNAYNSAQSAQSSAASSSSSAASASNYATLASSFGAQSLNADPYFADPNWTGGQGTLPSGWALWADDGGSYFGPYGDTAINPYSRGRSIQFDRGGANTGIVQTVQKTTPAGYYVLEGDASIQDGDWHGSGVYIDMPNGANYRIDFGNDPDSNETTGNNYPGSPNVQRRTFAKLIRFGSDTSSFNIYAMSGWQGFSAYYGAGVGFSRVIWHKALIRPATPGEITAQKAAADGAANTATINAVNSTLTNSISSVALRASSLEATAGNLNARVGTTENAVSDLYGKTSARFQIDTVAGNNRAQLSVHADANGGAGVDIVGDVAITGSNGNGRTVISGSGMNIYYPNGQIAVRLGI